VAPARGRTLILVGRDFRKSFVDWNECTVHVRERKRPAHDDTIGDSYCSRDKQESVSMPLFGYPAHHETAAFLPRMKLLRTERRTVTTLTMDLKNNSSDIGPHRRADERIYLYCQHPRLPFERECRAALRPSRDRRNVRQNYASSEIQSPKEDNLFPDETRIDRSWVDPSPKKT